ncbi:MAG TPA: hypothetical protein VEQ58_17180, partial [Polyangiaceae bacterium]|nr:hypothetical protein [Polyangiaceae bacterium]
AADRAVATRETLKAELAAVEDRFAYVSVLVQGSAGADTRVTCDGQALPPGSLGVPLSLLPGKHEFQAFGPGVESSKVALNLTPRAVEMVSLTLTDPNAAAPIPATTPSVAPESEAPTPKSAAPLPLDSQQADRRSVWTDRPFLVGAWASVGVAALSFSAGTYWALSQAGNKKADHIYASCATRGCDSSQIQEIEDLDRSAQSSRRVRAIGAFSLAVVGTGAAITLFALDKDAQNRQRLTPLLGLGYAGLRGRF